MHLKRSSTESTLLTHGKITRKIVILLVIFILSFSAERLDASSAKLYFSQGYENLQNRNYIEAIQDFTKAYTSDRYGPYGELAYIYIGKSYALLSYYSGKKEGVYSAIGFLNMYPFFYKRNNYVNLQLEFIADSYLLLDMYDKAMDIFFNLYKKSAASTYLLKLEYARVMTGTMETETLLSINPKDIGEDEYMYYLIQGFYQFNLGNYPLSIDYLTKAREMNRYLEDNEHFLYRYAVSYYMIGDWKKASFYMEILTRKDIYQKYKDFVDYYLALIYLKTDNHKDAFTRIESLIKGNLLSKPMARLLYSQLWAYPDFMKKYKDKFPNYAKLLVYTAWIDINNQLSIPAILGVYYFALTEGKIYDEALIKLKEVSLNQEVQIVGLKANLDPLLITLRQAYEKVDPYSEEWAEVLKNLYQTNPKNYVTLFSLEKLARSLVYIGDPQALHIATSLTNSIGYFLSGQAMLLEGKLDGLKLIDRSLKDLHGEDRQEALLILGIMQKNAKYLEEALKDDNLPARLSGYTQPAVFELADIYYKSKNYKRAKELYKKLVETSKEEDNIYWISIFRLAFSSKMLKDEETLNWVIDKVKNKDNIISKAIIELWG